METGRPTWPGFRRESYDSISEAVDPQAIYDALLRVYGDELRHPDPFGKGSVSRELNLAHEFAEVHLAVVAQAQTADDEGAVQQDSAD